jgi:DNA topoisomerase III
MTSVIGHLTDAVFDDEYERDWNYPPPESLFSAQVHIKVDKVCRCSIAGE